MRAHESVGRVYRRCGCRDERRRQLGVHCPQLMSDPAHGTWTFAVDLPATEPGGHNRTVRRGGFPTEDEARTALHRYRAGRRIGVSADPNQTVADYLVQWLAAKRLRLKATTWVRYRDYVHHDLIPALGPVRLDELAYEHIHHFVLAQLAAGRGRPTVWHILATLSSAIGDAVRQHRLPTNVVRPTVIPRPVSGERTIWTPAQAIRFLRHCHANDPDFGDLIEFLIGTGLRKGEALGLHLDDVHLDARTVYVRWTLSAIDNNKLALTRPKTRKSSDWVALSPRIHAILTRRKTQCYAPGEQGGGFVFHREDGRPLHPEYVFNHFRYLARQAGVPRTSVHDLRHSTISTTANIYGHLTKPAARKAVDAIAKQLDCEEKRYDHTTTTSPPAPRSQPHSDQYTQAA
ncbi:site-specific integrase [Streptomyces rugosispiralis]|uniref:Site-specific integrase n=1 Tax=Streptomyces rugosispiralis TaxID=2967341 RepID=A0ABT1UYB3_9ACTN|nr:site-specific integrase [Streptomyces rugosispiralis]MCQ8190112.1 site-specific integrase [Streptomyces rugosispiralis]